MECRCDEWDTEKAKAKLKAKPAAFICDTLLNQDIFSGVGNIIKNELLYRIRIHPESKTGKILSAQINKLIAETRIYSFQFLDWKRKYELKKHWLAQTKKICLKCNLAFIKKQTGAKKAKEFSLYKLLGFVWITFSTLPLFIKEGCELSTYLQKIYS